MNKSKVVKFVARFAVGAGTQNITKSIIQNNVATDNIYTKITVTAASIVIGAMATDATKAYTDEKVDEMIALFVPSADEEASDEETPEPVIDPTKA